LIREEALHLLGLKGTPSDIEIKAAYRHKALLWHPDVNKSAESEANFKQITEAYSLLSEAPQNEVERLLFEALSNSVVYVVYGRREVHHIVPKEMLVESVRSEFNPHYAYETSIEIGGRKFEIDRERLPDSPDGTWNLGKRKVLIEWVDRNKGTKRPKQDWRWQASSWDEFYEFLELYAKTAKTLGSRRQKERKHPSLTMEKLA
jgi:curved DNA-binding protein CbpA